MEFVHTERDDKERITYLTLGNTENTKTIDASTPANRAMGKSALTAASDYFFFERYTGEPGLHFLTEPSDKGFEILAGYAAAWHTNDDVPKPKAGWKPLIRRGNNLFLGDFNDERHATLASAKHDAIDCFMSGMGLRVRLFTNQGLAEYWLELWSKSKADAQKASEKAINATQNMERATGRTKERQQEYINAPPPPQKDAPPNFSMKMKGNVMVPMASLPPGWYWVCNRRGSRQKREHWDGINTQAWLNLTEWDYMLDTLDLEVQI